MALRIDRRRQNLGSIGEMLLAAGVIPMALIDCRFALYFTVARFSVSRVIG